MNASIRVPQVPSATAAVPAPLDRQVSLYVRARGSDVVLVRLMEKVPAPVGTPRTVRANARHGTWRHIDYIFLKDEFEGTAQEQPDCNYLMTCSTRCKPVPFKSHHQPQLVTRYGNSSEVVCHMMAAHAPALTCLNLRSTPRRFRRGAWVWLGGGARLRSLLLSRCRLHARYDGASRRTGQICMQHRRT